MKLVTYNIESWGFEETYPHTEPGLSAYAWEAFERQQLNRWGAPAPPFRWGGKPPCPFYFWWDGEYFVED
jgi:hypothetical protein